MKTATWADGLVRVYELEEEGIKARLAALRHEQELQEQHLAETDTLIQREEQAVRNLFAQAIAPDLLGVSLRYCGSLQRSKAQSHKLLQENNDLQERTREALLIAVEKRTMLHNLQQKEIVRIMADAERQEELFVAEITQQAFIKENA